MKSSKTDKMVELNSQLLFIKSIQDIIACFGF